MSEFHFYTDHRLLTSKIKTNKKYIPTKRTLTKHKYIKSNEKYKTLRERDGRGRKGKGGEREEEEREVYNINQRYNTLIKAMKNALKSASEETEKKTG